MALLINSNSLNPVVKEVSPVVVVSPKVQTVAVDTSYVVSPQLMYTTIPVPIKKFDNGLNDNFLVQQKMTKYIQYRILDDWLYKKDLCNVLKLLKIVNDKVEPISDMNAEQSNKGCSEDVESIQKKADYIEQHILTETATKKLLEKIMSNLGYEWAYLPNYGKVIRESAEIYIRDELKKLIKK